MLFLNPLEKIFKHSSNKTHKVSSRKHPYFPYREFPGGGGGGGRGDLYTVRPNNVKEM